MFCLYRLAPPLQPTKGAPPATALHPFEAFDVPRPGAPGVLSGWWFSTPPPRRGVVLLLHPWLPWGQAYFHRRGRLTLLREAGYDVVTLDLPGLGRSGPPRGFWDRDIEVAIAAIRARLDGAPLHIWGVSSGGYWAHLGLSRWDGVSGAVFEDVSPHLVEWTRLVLPGARWPIYTFFPYLLGRAYRFLDTRLHAPRLRLRAAAYVGGDKDPGIPAEHTRALAGLAQAECLLISGAVHLAAFQVASEKVASVALKTFRRAEASNSGEQRREAACLPRPILT